MSDDDAFSTTPRSPRSLLKTLIVTARPGGFLGLRGEPNCLEGAVRPLGGGAPRLLLAGRWDGVVTVAGPDGEGRPGR